jgi:nitronate monooxygenase
MVRQTIRCSIPIHWTCAMAPEGYPAIHHLTSPIRKAAAAAGDPERINLWAGTGYRHATDAPAGEILKALASKAQRRR